MLGMLGEMVQVWRLHRLMAARHPAMPLQLVAPQLLLTHWARARPSHPCTAGQAPISLPSAPGP
jgi:hypothetical protein